MTTIYVLKLKKNKFYVGRTDKNAITRFKEHKAGKGSAWTRKYAPVEIVYVKNGDKFDEDKLTKKYMADYGIDNVRGGSYCQITLDLNTRNVIEKEINSGTNKCYNCGEKGHYIQHCPYEEVWCCNYCDKEFTSKRGCAMHENMHCKHRPRSNRRYAKTESAGKRVKCYKCGKYGHYANYCYRGW